MKWVKASERLPESNGVYICKTDYIAYSIRYLRFENDWQGGKDEVIEWLDESPIKEDGEDELWQEVYKIIHSTHRTDDVYGKLKCQFHITRKQ